jgi:uncharacterized protein YegJ (DUF2314 family)
MIRQFAVAAVMAMLLVGCSKKEPKDKVTYVSDNDPQMNAAIERARAEVNTFITAIQSPRAGQSSFSVKMAFSDGKHTEHMWLGSVTFDGKRFHGTVNNDPEKVTNVKFGQKATVSAAEISDWMFVQNRKLVGGYTLRVLRDSLSPSERAEFDSSVPFTVE